MSKGLEETAVDIMAKAWAKVYYYLAKEMIDRFGGEGEEALRSAVRRYGQEEGRFLRKKVLEVGKPIDTFSFKWAQGRYFMPVASTPSFKGEEKYRRPEEAYVEISSCPFADVWKDLPKGTEIGFIFCQEFHHPMWAGFDESFRVEQKQIKTKRDPICTFRTYREG